MSKTVVLRLSAKDIDTKKFCPRCVGLRSWLIVTARGGRKYRQCKTCGIKVEAS